MTDDKGLCNGADRELKQFQQFHCEAQQCAYDYCQWSMKLYIEECKEAAEEGEEEAPELPGWDTIYNFDELYGDYVTEPDFYYSSAACKNYYDMYENGEERYLKEAAAGSGGEEEEDEMDEEDMMSEQEEDEEDMYM